MGYRHYARYIAIFRNAIWPFTIPNGNADLNQESNQNIDLILLLRRPVKYSFVDLIIKCGNNENTY